MVSQERTPHPFVRVLNTSSRHCSPCVHEGAGLDSSFLALFVKACSGLHAACHDVQTRRCRRSTMTGIALQAFQSITCWDTAWLHLLPCLQPAQGPHSCTSARAIDSAGLFCSEQHTTIIGLAQPLLAYIFIAQASFYCKVLFSVTGPPLS
jgi:hypothetical protein